MSDLVDSIKDIIGHAKETGKVKASPELKKKRMEICEKCPHYITKPYNQPRCGICRCFLKIKTAAAGTKCPKGIWEAKMIADLLTPDRYNKDIPYEELEEQCCV